MNAEKIKKGIRNNYKGWLFVSPLVLGLLIFTLYPTVCSLIYSLHDTDLVHPMANFGFQNYAALFNGSNASDLFWKSLGNTFLYSVIYIPLSMVLTYLLAWLLNKASKGTYVFRVIYYLPVLIPGVVVGLLWQDILNVEYGIFNILLRDLFGTSFDFLTSDHIMGTFIAIQFFNVGGGMIIWIASFKSIPQSMYEAARLDLSLIHISITDGKDKRVTVKVLRCINEHFTEDISLASVAQEIGYTKEYCSKIFRDIVGVRFRDYLNLLRLRKAKRCV